jgi:hypothetical protein
LDNLSIIYIGVCDWGEVGRLREDNPSPYGFMIKEEIEQLQWWVVPKLFYTYGERGSIKSPQRMGLTCLQTLKSKTYLMGKLPKLNIGKKRLMLNIL